MKNYLLNEKAKDLKNTAIQPTEQYGKRTVVSICGGVGSSGNSLFKRLRGEAASWAAHYSPSDYQLTFAGCSPGVDIDPWVSSP